MEGIIVKGIAGFYYVSTGEQVLQCKARGIFKKKKITPLIGDRVIISIPETGDAVIEEILPRRNEFIRPPVSNVDCFVVVAACVDPRPNLTVIDKFIVMAERNNADVIMCINKTDIAEPEDIALIEDIYEGLYPIVYVSGQTGEGIETLKKAIGSRSCALAGPSGAGKSTIINHIVPEAGSETGEVSIKTKRGKHTTRHVEIFRTDEGNMIYDTPGFTSFDMSGIEEDELGDLFPEIANLRSSCKFDNCRHIKEPGCEIRLALQDGRISKSRYESYLTQIEEIRSKRRF